MSTGSRRGRRPGSPDTRAAILDAARTRFAEAGFAATSVRRVAADAGVDPALVHHYFGTKDDLFVAALELRIDPRDVVPRMVAAGVDGAGERLVRLFLEVWDDGEARLPLLALLRGVLEPGGERLVRDGFVRMVLTPVGEGLRIDQPERRMSLVASQMFGVVLFRHVVAVEPLASDERERLVATLAPIIQGYLSGPLP